MLRHTINCNKMHPKLKEFFTNLKVGIRATARKAFCCHLKKKKRIIIWSVVGSLALLAFVLGLLTGSIGTVNPRSVGIHASSVSLRTSTQVATSGVYFAGLGATYYQLPKPGYDDSDSDQNFKLHLQTPQLQAISKPIRALQ